MKPPSASSALLRISIVLLIMLETIRRYLFCGTRPIDIVMMIISLLVLVIVVVEAIVMFVNWWREKHLLKDEEKGLDNLSPATQEALRAFILGGLPPGGEALRELRNETPYIIRFESSGTFIQPEHKRSLKKWAKKNHGKRDKT